MPTVAIPEFMKNVIVTEEKLAAVTAQLARDPYVIFDLESSGLSFLTDTIVGIGIGTIDEAVENITMAVYIPVEYHNGIEELIPHGTNTFLSRETVFNALRPFFLDWKKIIIAHNLKFDMQFIYAVYD
jgi:DNA polymerase III alpha subunit (gram-positive type)